ncbi:hypothetical protein PQR68_37525, partial [Paraburkholderia agricolaris]|uniref:hypothetical protein n=1 Tax=Paraburkholderia agricolaris TaxID=2152888 RepID=UPI0038B839EA
MLDYKGRWARRAFGGWFGACSAVFVIWLFVVLWCFGLFLLGSWSVWGCPPGFLAFPCCVSGLLALRLCGAALTFFAAVYR